MTPKLDFSRGERIADKYEVVDLLDESPLGVTYRAKHLKTGKYVRLVMLRPKVAGREHKDALMEAFRKAKALNHPNLLKVGELAENDGVAYFTYEDFEALTLRELVRTYRVEDRTFEIAEAAQITQQVLEALDALHQSGQVMRALRPEYVLVNVRYTGPRKTTFIAQSKVVTPLWELVPTAMLAEDDFTRGDVQYVAPELKSPDHAEDARVDVYSAGVILQELLNGRTDVPKPLQTVLELAVARAPEDRYATCVDFLTNLVHTFQDGAILEAQPRRPLLGPGVWAAAFALVAVTAILVFSTRRDPRVDAETADAQVREQVYREVLASTPPLDEFKRVYEQHPPNMIYLPRGPFVAGRLREDTFAGTAEPLAEPRETGGFLIDMFEYPNLQGAPPQYNVTWDEADRLCKEAGKRLCTADEWERACKGPRSTVYSYGDTYDPEFCGAGLADRRASGAADACRSEYGVYDLSGNFREWTASSKKAGRMLVKGGMVGSPEKGTRCAHSEDESAAYTDRTLSFRCCRDADAPPFSAALDPAPNEKLERP